MCERVQARCQAGITSFDDLLPAGVAAASPSLAHSRPAGPSGTGSTPARGPAAAAPPAAHESSGVLASVAVEGHLIASGSVGDDSGNDSDSDSDSDSESSSSGGSSASAKRRADAVEDLSWLNLGEFRPTIGEMVLLRARACKKQKLNDLTPAKAVPPIAAAAPSVSAMQMPTLTSSTAAARGRAGGVAGRGRGRGRGRGHHLKSSYLVPGVAAVATTASVPASGGPDVPMNGGRGRGRGGRGRGRGRGTGFNIASLSRMAADGLPGTATLHPAAKSRLPELDMTGNFSGSQVAELMARLADKPDGDDGIDGLKTLRVRSMACGAPRSRFVAAVCCQQARLGCVVAAAGARSLACRGYLGF